MRKNIRLSFAALAMFAIMLVLASCGKEGRQQVEPTGVPATLTATIEQMVDPTATKTGLGPKNEGDGTYPLLFKTGDAVAVYSAGQVPGLRTITFSRYVTEGSGTTATFNLQYSIQTEAPGDVVNYFNTNNFFLSTYSADEKPVLTKVGAAGITLSPYQSYAVNSFGPTANPMVSAAVLGSGGTGPTLEFKNVNGALKFLLYGDGVKVSQVVLRSSEAVLSGPAVVSYVSTESSGDGQTIEMDPAGNKYVCLNCYPPDTLSTTEATEFIISVPPTPAEATTYALTVEIGTDQGIMTKDIKDDVRNKIKKGEILKMKEVTLPDDFDVLAYKENGTNHGTPTFIDGTWWAPVNCGYDATSNPYGLLYQWGRKVGQGYDKETNEPAIANPIAYQVTPKDNTFYKRTDATNYQWMQKNGENPAFDASTLWTDLPTATYGGKVGDPCPSGWRVPTETELKSLNDQGSTWVGENDTDKSPNGQKGRWYGTTHSAATTANQWGCVFLPASGYRYDDGTAFSRAIYGYYWSSTPNGANARYLYFFNGYSYMLSRGRAYGFAVRCVKD